MFVRRVARPLLAASFIQGGLNTLRDISGHAAAARPWLDENLSQVRASLPTKVPTDAETLVRFDAALKIGAGTMLALGKLPRLSAAVLACSTIPTTFAAHAFWEEQDPERRAGQQIHFLKNAGLLGGLLIAAVDTEGKPSMRHRVRHTSRTTRR